MSTLGSLSGVQCSPIWKKVFDFSEVLYEIRQEIGGEGIAMRYTMKYGMRGLQWAGWPVDGGDKLSGRGQMTLIAAIGHVEDGLVLTCLSSVLPSDNTHSLCNLSL